MGEGAGRHDGLSPPALRYEASQCRTALLSRRQLNLALADEVVQLLPWDQSSHMQLEEWLENGENFQFMEIANMGHSSDQKEIDALNMMLQSV